MAVYVFYSKYISMENFALLDPVHITKVFGHLSIFQMETTSVVPVYCLYDVTVPKTKSFTPRGAKSYLKDFTSKEKGSRNENERDAPESVAVEVHDPQAYRKIIMTRERGSVLHLIQENVSIFHGCMVWIEKSVTRVTDRHHEACRVMPNSDPE